MYDFYLIIISLAVNTDFQIECKSVHKSEYLTVGKELPGLFYSHHEVTISDRN